VSTVQGQGNGGARRGTPRHRDLKDPSPVPLQEVEVGKFTNDVSRVADGRQWLTVTGHQTKASGLKAAR
jgi:hypothetical protein